MIPADARPQPAPERFLDYEKSLACIHCGLCLSSCPTYLETGNENDSPRGRIYLMRAVQEGRMPLGNTAVRHLDLCLGCRACEAVCPSGVEYGALLESTRDHIEKHHARSTWQIFLRRFLIEKIFPFPRQPIGIGRQLRGQYLDGDLALQVRVGRPIHLPHSALAEERGHFIGAEPGAGSQSQFAVDYRGELPGRPRMTSIAHATSTGVPSHTATLRALMTLPAAASCAVSASSGWTAPRAESSRARTSDSPSHRGKTGATSNGVPSGR